MTSRVSCCPNKSALTPSRDYSNKACFRRRRHRNPSNAVFVVTVIIFFAFSTMKSARAFSDAHGHHFWGRCAAARQCSVRFVSGRWTMMSEFSPQRPRTFVDALSTLQMISATTVASIGSKVATMTESQLAPTSTLSRTALADLLEYENSISTVPSRTRACCHQIFDLELPEGRCIGLRLQEISPIHPDALTPEAVHHPDHWIHTLLHPQEVQFGMSEPSEQASVSFFLGRLAMREILRRGPRDALTSILKDEHGRPQVPKGYLGSISHKRTVGVALVAPDVPHVTERPQKGIGVDIEQTFSRHRSIAKKVLTENEMNQLGKITGVTHDEEVLLRFSIKESLYKAMHPLICQYVGFQEAEVTPHADGTASVDFQLKSGAHERFESVTAHWRRLDCGEFFLTSASISLRKE